MRATLVIITREPQWGVINARAREDRSVDRREHPGGTGGLT